MHISRGRVVASARSYIGTQFVWGGRTSNGVDCGGLVERVANDLKVQYGDDLDYEMNPSGEDIIKRLSNGLWLKPGLSYRSGDVLVFWLNKIDIARHIGIASPEGMIHTNSSVGRVCENSIGEFWGRRLMAVFQFPEIV